MTSNVENLEIFVMRKLEDEPVITPEVIRLRVGQLRVTPITEVTDDEAEALIRKIEANSEIQIGVGTMLEARHRPWVAATRAERDHHYWNRYSLLMARRLPKQVVTAMDSITDEILDALQDPTSDGTWDRRGMVVGHVQSGKTANYTGLICKAADAGYRIIIVIAGSLNDLRRQTQLRIDSGFVGWDSAKKPGPTVDGLIGVGRIDSERRPWTFTEVSRDFNKATAEQVGGDLSSLNVPAVFVIKKNASTLKSLNGWLKQHNAKRGTNRIATPMLLIDDEADNASINTSSDPDKASRINAGIRELLSLFDRSSYVGYTATPFANIFIDPDTEMAMLGDDLFPRDFIVSLDPPSNYVGANRVFLDEPEQFLRVIDDNQTLLPVRQKRNLIVPELPESLRLALRTFVLAQAVRLARGQKREHNSMLINVSRFNDVQRQITRLVQDQIGSIRMSLRLHGAGTIQNGIADPEIRMLHDAWVGEYEDSIHDQSWESVFPFLHAAAGPIEVLEINQGSSATLDYENYQETGRSVIAVGGLALSRGLTLEGLSISYFLRNSQMYDTLMQMGRWFGYRPGYDDLCRVWMPDEAAGWYAHIAESIDLLRDDLRKMKLAGGTPNDFGLRVRSHPDSLIVTARNKMGTSEKVPVQIGLTGQLIETATLRADAVSRATNLAALDQFVHGLIATGANIPMIPETGGYLIRGVESQHVTEFLRKFQNHSASFVTDPGPVCQYIEDRDDSELSRWDVLISSVGAATGQLNSMTYEFLPGRVVRCPYRTAGDDTTDLKILVTNRLRVASRGVEKVGLTPEQVVVAETSYLESYKGSDVKEGKPSFPDRIYRAIRTRPLIVIHPLDIRDPRKQDDRKVRPDALDRMFDEPVVAWSISFPDSEKVEKRVTYVVNTRALREMFGESNDEDDDAAEA